MDCEAVVSLLWEYLDRELGSEEAGAVRAHLSRCPGCHPLYRCHRAFLELLARQRERCSASPSLRLAIRSRLYLS
jgi:anti-sigma factor (TIGR02949 family)